jgi:hypothetical protein
MVGNVAIVYSFTGLVKKQRLTFPYTGRATFQS